MAGDGEETGERKTRTAGSQDQPQTPTATTADSGKIELLSFRKRERARRPRRAGTEAAGACWPRRPVKAAEGRGPEQREVGGSAREWGAGRPGNPALARTSPRPGGLGGAGLGSGARPQA